MSTTNEWFRRLFPPVKSSTILSHYIPMTGAISHNLFAIHVFAPSLTTSLFSNYDYAIGNVLLFNTHVGIGFYAYYRRHMRRLTRYDRVECGVMHSIVFNFGSILLYVVIKGIVPYRTNRWLKAIIGSILSVALLTRAAKYYTNVDRIITTKEDIHS